MFCIKCGAQLPDDAKFCFACGATVPSGASSGGSGGSSTSSSAPTTPTLAPAGVQELKCPSCGAPIKPSFGEAIVTCDYCGSSVTLGGSGWKEISKHSMLTIKVGDANAALAVVKAYVDTGFLHRKEFQESKITSQKLSMVPYWVLPVSASTNYQYQDAAVGIGSTVATIGASALLGSALSGNRGMTIIPIMGGPVVNPTRQDTITGQYEFPVVAVKAMATYQPKSYQFPLAERGLFDKKQVPDGTSILNGDFTEDAARNSARALVTQLQSEEAHKRHRMVSHFQTNVDVSEGELLHAPVWEFVLEHKSGTRRVLVDAHAGRVMT
ncbi:MAG: zinc ribbon domain-containing protein [Thermoplasmata archaeon]